MTRLLKASTARRRANSVDLTALTIEGIANAIEDYSSQGIFGFETSIPETHEDAVVPLLEKAGYTVTYPEYSGLVEWHNGRFSRDRGWFSRLLEKLGFAPKENVFCPAIMDNGYVQLAISWAPDGAAEAVDNA